MITVYSQPNCQMCVATKRWLDRKGIPYEEGALMEYPDVLALANANGVTSAPVVVVADHGGVAREVWGGFNVERLRAYADSVGAA